MRAQAAKISDIPKIFNLWHRFMVEEDDAVPDSDIASTGKHWVERLRTQITNQHVYIALEGHHIVGFLGFIDSTYREWINDGIAYIVDIYVLPKYRSSNAFRLLIRAFSEKANSSDYSEIWTNTHERNQRVQVLLRREKFEQFQDFKINGLKNQLYYKKSISRA